MILPIEYFGFGADTDSMIPTKHLLKIFKCVSNLITPYTNVIANKISIIF